MPSFHGIDVFITASGEVGRGPLKEYPHPESLQATPGRVSTAVAECEKAAEKSLVKKQDAAAAASPKQPTIAKQDSRISVYIASQPYARFSVDYKITLWPPTPPGAPSDVRYLFFKVFINGRREVAWGIDLEKNTKGSAAQALYSPGRLYEYTDERGRTMVRPGIETRSFCFLPQDNKATSVASEGGLIEVQVFRAYGRSRRAPNPLPYRSHENYGIGLMSEGLVAKPEENRYYSYTLADASDSPYAAFRFHYRSWANLNELQIVRQDELEGPAELPGSAVTAQEKITPRSNHGLSRLWQDLEEFGCHLSDEQRAQSQSLVSKGGIVPTASRAASVRRGSSRGSNHEKTGGVSRRSSGRYSDSSIFDDSDESAQSPRSSSDRLRGRSSTGESYYYLKSPPQLHPTATTNSDRIPQPSKAVRDFTAIDNPGGRPLPELPVPDLPDEAGLRIPTSKRHSSVSSGTPSVATSMAASIAPSLLPYVEGDTFIFDFEYTAARRASLEKGKANEIELGTRGDSPTSLRHRTAADMLDTGDKDQEEPSWVDGALEENTPGSSDYRSSVESLESLEEDYLYHSKELSPAAYHSAALNSPKRRFASMPSPSSIAWRGSGGAGGGSVVGAGKVSPKAKQLLGEELDYSSSFATCAESSSTAAAMPFAREGRRSGTSATLGMAESEWIGGGRGLDTAPSVSTTSWSPGSERRRHPSRGSFLSKLWSPRLRSTNNTSNNRDDQSDGRPFEKRIVGGKDSNMAPSPWSSPSSSASGAPAADMKSKNRQTKKRTGSSLVVGLGGHVPPNEKWV